MTETKRENTSIWNDFNKLTHLSLYYSDSSGNGGAAIYANNKNQVKIGIKVRAENQQGQPLNLTEDDLKGKVFLCDSITGNKINESKWTVSDNDNGYSKAVNYSGQHRAKRESDDSVYIQKYLSSSSPNEHQYRFSVSIDIPGVGEFNTSDNGTSTKNAPKGESRSLFKAPKSLMISTLPPIDYSLSDNITVRHMPKSIDDFSKVVSDMKIIRGYSTNMDDFSNPIWYEGISSKTTFTIHPHLENKGYFFHLVNPVRNNANLYSCDFAEKPDMIRSKTSNDNFDLQFVFVNQSVYGLRDGSCFVVNNYPGTLYTYHIGRSDSRHYWIDMSDYNFIKVRICNHRVPWSNIKRLTSEYKYGWDEQRKPIEIEVTDNYGNSGIIKIEAPNNEDSWPKLYVNGQ